MPLHRVGARERILLMGGMGAGKTRSYHSLIQWLRRTQSTARTFVIDTDKSFTRMVEGFGGFDAYPNTFIYPPITWVEGAPLQADMTWELYKQGLAQSKASATVHDVLVVDMISWPWSTVQDWYTNSAFGKSKAKYFLEARKSMSEGDTGGLAAFKTAWGADWQVINAEYAETANMIINFPGHVIACSAMEAVNRKTDDTDTINTFGRFGFKPTGQKFTGHLFHTCLAMEQTSNGFQTIWAMTTIKDRERQEMVKWPVNDFVMDYLVRVAGWKLA